MSDAKALLQRIFDEIINEGRLEATDELIAADFVDHGPMGVIQGREAFKAMVAMWRSAVPDVHCTVENVVTDGELVGWLVRTTGTHSGDGLGFPATGKPFETLSANLGRLRDGMAVEHWSEQGMLSMLTQLDLLPLPGSGG
jgi:predicted ester cyclase